MCGVSACACVTHVILFITSTFYIICLLLNMTWARSGCGGGDQDVSMCVHFKNNTSFQAVWLIRKVCTCTYYYIHVFIEA